MIEFFVHLFDVSGFPARWHCGRWTDGHGWLHVLSDLAIFGAYLAIPLVLAALMLRRRDLPSCASSGSSPRSSRRAAPVT